jgi:hypothetical protein
MKHKQENFTIPLDVIIGKIEDEQRYIGEMDSISIAALFIEFYPDWATQLRECVLQAEKENLLVETDLAKHSYILGSRNK